MNIMSQLMLSFLANSDKPNHTVSGDSLGALKGFLHPRAPKDLIFSCTEICRDTKTIGPKFET